MYFYNADDRSMDDEMSRTVDFSLPLALKSVTSDMINPENEVNAKVSITFLGRNIYDNSQSNIGNLLSIYFRYFIYQNTFKYLFYLSRIH